MTYSQAVVPHGFKIHLVKDADGNPIKNADGNYQLNFTYYVRAPKFRVVVFKGGGGRTWVYKKFLHIIEENGIINDVKEYGGSSAGALFAVLAAMPLEYQEREIIVDQLEFHKDILDDSFASKTYIVVTCPFYLVSKPLEWISKIFAKVAEKCNPYLLGKFIGWPLNIIAGIFCLVSTITHPQFAAGTYNLITKGGIYRGKKLQEYIRDSIYDNTKKCLERSLNNIDNIKTRLRVMTKLAKIPGLIQQIKTNPDTHITHLALLTKDITFAHFHHLSKIKDLGFKNIFLTATRCRDTPQGRLKIFNHISDAKRSIHQAVRMSMSAPIIYQTVSDNGMEYMDGGCADNFPILHASTRPYANRFEERFCRGQYNQDLDVVGVRVEYEKDLGILFEPIKIITHWWDKFTNALEKFIYNKLCGMDIYESEEKVQNAIKEKYPLRVLQLYDHGVGFTEVGIESPRKDKIFECEEKRINRFLKAHNGELVHTEHYHSLSCTNKYGMSNKTQKKFLKFLSKTSIPDSEIFLDDISNFPSDELRKELIHTLTINTKGTQIFTRKKKHEQDGSTRHIFNTIKTPGNSEETRMDKEMKNNPLYEINCSSTLWNTRASRQKKETSRMMHITRAYCPFDGAC